MTVAPRESNGCGRPHTQQEQAMNGKHGRTELNATGVLMLCELLHGPFIYHPFSYLLLVFFFAFSFSFHIQIFVKVSMALAGPSSPSPPSTSASASATSSFE